VTRYSTGIVDSPDYSTYDIDYPQGAPLPLAGVAIIPGYVQARAAVGDWGPFLASHGFVVITIDPNATGDAPAARATALWGAVGSLKAENSRSGGPLSGKVDTAHLAVMGASMGGGGALECASAHAELRGVVALSAWDSTGTTFSTLTAPTLILAGQNDTVATPTLQTSFYTSIPVSTPKVYAEFAGGDAYISNTPIKNTPIVGLLGLSWLKVHVEGDGRYAQFIETQSVLSSFMSSP
jgi:predicted dienelactone hydrolase